LPEQRQPLVAFALSREPKQLPDSFWLLFVPSDNSWNDFGFQLHADIGIRNSPGPFTWVSGFLAFKDQNSSWRFVKQLIDEAGASWVSADHVKVSFASMLRDVKAYQQLVRILEPAGAEAAAIAAHDAAFSGARHRTLESWPDFSASRAFNRVFMRFSETVFAYENAAIVFAGQPLDAEDARQDFTAVVRLGRSSLTYSFGFPIGGMAENRLSVIIGRNGTGKTASLIALARGLLDRAARGVKIEPSCSFNQLLVYAHSRSLRRFKLSTRSARAVAQKTFGLDPTTTATSRRELTVQLAAMVRESDHLESPLRTLVSVVETEFHGLKIWVPVLDDLSGKTEYINDSRYAPLNRFYQLAEQARLDAASQIDVHRPLVFLGPDEQPRSLSLGQDVFIGFAFHAISRSGPACVFLIDEPENFLHPNLVSRFVRLLHRILQTTKSIAVVATHSPYVVREVQRSQVHVLSSTSEGVEVNHPRLQTFGANVGAISDHIFGDDMIEHLHIQLLRQTNLKDLPIEQWIQERREELSLDALMLLRQEREKNKDKP
jgi:predicted ATPase